MARTGLATLLALAFISLITGPSQAAVFYVDRTATGANNGTSWANAFTTIQAGIDAAHAVPGGAEVWVKAGTYTGCNSTPVSDSFEALDPDSVDILGEEKEYAYGAATVRKYVHVNILYLTGNVTVAPPRAQFAVTTENDTFTARLADLVQNNPDALVTVDHPSFTYGSGTIISREDLAAAANVDVMRVMEVKEAEDASKWDYVLAHLDDQAGDCSKVVWGINVEDQHRWQDVSAPVLVGVIPTSQQDPVYADRRLAFKDMMRRGSVVALSRCGRSGVPRYNLSSSGGTATKFEITVYSDQGYANGLYLRFYGCDWQTGTVSGTVLYQAPLTSGATNTVAYHLTQDGTATGTPLTPQQKANIKYIRPAVWKPDLELSYCDYLQPVRIKSNGSWWNGPAYTLAGGHAAIGPSPYPSGVGGDTGETIYFNTHTHTLISDGNVTPQAMRRVYWEKYGEADPVRPRFTIITDHETISPFAPAVGSVVELKQGARAYGGFRGGETAREQRDWSANRTIIDAQGQGRCVYSSGSDWTDQADALLDGFTIANGSVGGNGVGAGMYNWKCSPTVTNCSFTANQASFGAGMTNSLSSPTVTYCKFQSNSAGNTPPWRPGGGMLNEASSMPVIADCEFTNNVARRGGGMCNMESSPSVTGCIFRSNSVNGFVYGYGGGMYNWRSSIQVTNTLFEGNVSSAISGRGGAMYSTESQTSLNLCTFKDNQANGSYGTGGAVCFYYGNSSVSVTNCRFVGNTASGYLGIGGAVYLDQGSSAGITCNTLSWNTATTGGGIFSANCSPRIANNIIAFNSQGISLMSGSPILSHNNVFGNTVNYDGLSPGAGDISADPSFISAEDLHIPYTSPCIDAGDNTAASAVNFDMDGESRIYNKKVDIGADEYWPLTTHAGLKGVPDGSTASITDAVVTASFGSFVYVESKTRAWGIRVNKSTFEFPVGLAVDITGAIRTVGEGERYIEPSSVVQGAPYTIRPVFMTGRFVGGGTWFYSPVSGAGQRGVKYGLGLNNIGLLISTCGRVTDVGPGVFYIDDGSVVDEDLGYLGVKVLGSVPVLPGEDSVGKYVLVTGISSCQKIAPWPYLFRLIRATGVTIIP